MVIIDLINLHIGKKVRSRRRQLGISQIELGTSVGVSFQQIQKYESGLDRVAAHRLWLLAKALDMPINDFYDGLTNVDLEPAQRVAVR